MPRIPIPFGQGLDRETGVMATPPGSFELLKNLILFNGKAGVRHGWLQVQALTDTADQPVSKILGIFPFRSKGMVVIAALSAANQVLIFGAQRDGTHPFLIRYKPTNTPLQDYWFTVASGVTPRISAADAYDVMLLAHDSPKDDRAETIVYQPVGLTNLRPLMVDFDGDSVDETTVRFRGVERHLNYLFGWGWGTGSAVSRPEMVRVCLAGQPLEWDPEHYFIVGHRNEPVLRCVSLGKTLAVLKPFDSYRITGYSQDNFGWEPLDPLHGVAAPRLAISANGKLFAWGDVPWTSDGQEAREVSIPLDIEGPEPADLVAAGSVFNGFCGYLPSQQLVLFIFGRRIFCLSIRSEPWKWSYWELPFTPDCAALLYSGELGGEDEFAPPPADTSWPAVVPVLAPNGYTETIAAWGVNSVTGYEAVAPFVNHSPQSSYTVECWLRAPGGSWTLWGDPIAAGSEGTRQVYPVNGSDNYPLEPNTKYSITFRYVNGALVGTDYGGRLDIGPDSWTALTTYPERVTEFTTGPASIHITSATWSRREDDTEMVALWIDGQDTTAHTKVYISLTGTFSGEEVEVTTSDLEPSDNPIYWEHTLSIAGTYSDRTVYYQARTSDGPNAGDASPATSVWTGPDLVCGPPQAWNFMGVPPEPGPPDIGTRYAPLPLVTGRIGFDLTRKLVSIYFSVGNWVYDLADMWPHWEQDSSIYMEAWISIDGGPWAVWYHTSDAGLYYMTADQYEGPTAYPVGSVIRIRMRTAKAYSPGSYDYSPYTDYSEVTL